MHYACTHADCMSKAVQIRNMPETLHRRLKARAALAGMSVSEYALLELKRTLEQPTTQEILERLAALPPIEATPSPAKILREERNRR